MPTAVGKLALPEKQHGLRARKRGLLDKWRWFLSHVTFHGWVQSHRPRDLAWCSPAWILLLIAR